MRRTEQIARHAQTSEKALERYLVSQAHDNGLVCLKYFNAHEAGYPDRILLLPEGRVLWVELKSAGCKPTALQHYRIKSLRQHGHRVVVADSREVIDAIFSELLFDGMI